MTAIRVAITRSAGSVPRGVGTSMLVWPDRIDGTIGGGALEWQAMARAREMIANGQDQAREVVPLGPALGQCCGGSVTLDFSVAKDMPAKQGAPFWIYGAGHVGRALVAVLAPLPEFAITWVDTSADRFPDIPQGVTPLVAADPVRVVPLAPDRAHHLILTYSHQIDLALCHAVLGRAFASAGVIGSATKWARFKQRLTALGHAPHDISRIACPIGDPNLGKHPQAIAIGVAQVLLGGQAHGFAEGTG